MNRVILRNWLFFFSVFCPLLIFGQTVYQMDFTDYPAGSHEAQPSLNERWSKQISNQTGTMAVTNVASSLQGKGFTGMSGVNENYRTFRWDYQNYSGGIPSNALPASANSEITIRFKFSGISREFCGVVLHRTGPASSANALVVFASIYNGTPSVGYQKWENGSPIFYSSTFPTPQWNANTWYYVKVRRNLDSLKIKFWDASQAEPSSWTGSWMEEYGYGVPAKPEFAARGVNEITIDYFRFKDLTVSYSLQLTSNLTGLSVKTGSQVSLSWNQLGIDTVGIYYSADYGQTYKWAGHSLSSVDGIHSYNWTVPEGIISENCFVKLESSGIKDSSQMFTISPEAYIKITNTPALVSGGTLPDSVMIAFKSIAVDSVNIYYSTDSLNWIMIKEHFSVENNGFQDSSVYKWIPDRKKIQGGLYIKVSEASDTTTIFPVKRKSELTFIGISAPPTNGYQNVVWHSNPIKANGKLFQLSVKTFHWGFFGISQLYLYSYNKLSRSWTFTASRPWEFDPYMDNAYYADSGNVNLYYFGGEFLTRPGSYFYIQISLTGNDFTFRNYDRAISSAPLEATDPQTYPISGGSGIKVAEYLGRAYYLVGNRIFYSDSSGYLLPQLPFDTALYADMKGTNAENLDNIGIYAYDNRVMVTSFYNSTGTAPYNYAFKALPRKSEHFASDVLKIGDNLIAKRNMFRGISPKAKR